MSMSSPTLIITDGVDVVNLIDNGTGFHLQDWTPQIIQPKDGGVFASSPMSDGRQKRQRVWDNAIETFSLVVNHYDQDALIRDTQTLRRLLLKVDSYWISQGDLGGMVWIEKRASCETNTSYALIYDWRTPNDDNPFSAPFMANTAFSAMDSFTLVLERGHWTENAPSIGTCVETSGLGSWYSWGGNQLENPGFETAGGGGADVFGSWAETAGDGAIASSATVHTGAASALLTAGPTRNTEITQSQAGLVAGSEATLGFWARGNGAVPGRYAVYNVTGAAYIQPVTSTGVTAATFAFVSYSFTLPVGCTEVRIELWCADTNAAETRFDDVELRIRGAAWTPGRAVTCTDEVFVAGKQNIAQLTDVFRYDSSAGTYTQILGTALPYNLFPPDPPVNDILYFIIDTSVPDSGPFSSLVFDLGTGSVNITTIVWEYPTAPAVWSALTVQDNTYGFLGTGIKQVSWLQPSDWITTTVNGVSGWIVRARITVTGGAVTIPTQRNRQIYTITWGSFLVDDLQIAGDIGALRRTDFYNPNGSTVTGLYSYRLISGLRSTVRGTDFSAFINLSDEQNMTDIYVAVTPGLTDMYLTDNVRSSTGRVVRFVGQVADPSCRLQISFASGTGIQYSGIFRAFLRYSWTGAGSTNDRCTAWLGWSLGSVGYITYNQPITFYFPDLVTYTGSALYAIADLGQFELPLAKLKASDVSLSDLVISILVEGYAAYTMPLDLLDLILIPADESICDTMTRSRTEDPSRGARAGSMVGPSIDSIDPPTQITRSVLRWLSNKTTPQGSWLTANPGELIWQPNTEQRLWILPVQQGVYHATSYLIERTAAYIEQIVRVQNYRNNRYLGMRGDR